jgi:hypothetical protein
VNERVEVIDDALIKAVELRYATACRRRDRAACAVGDIELRLDDVGAQILAHRVPRQPPAPRDLPDRVMVPTAPASDDAQYGEAGFDRGAVNVVDNLVTNLADQPADVFVIKTTAEDILQALFERRHGDDRLQGQLVADLMANFLLEWR